MSEPRLCKAHSSRTGQPCKKVATPGTTVCRSHGSAAPQVIAKARQRLLEALDPAAAELVKIAKGQAKRTVVTKEGETFEVPAGPVVQLRAIEAVLDRAGLPAKVEIESEVHGGQDDLLRAALADPALAGDLGEVLARVAQRLQKPEVPP